ncbi:MAG: hypothetical protein U0R26_03720 [Solirubrobacterales bacterium]
MTNRRSKAIATATVLGLGALGGVALGTNPGVPSATQQASGSATAAVATGASGASALPTGQTVALKSNATTRAPIVTRASGTGAAAPRDD